LAENHRQKTSDLFVDRSSSFNLLPAAANQWASELDASRPPL